MKDRLAKQYLLAHPDDCVPPHGLDLEVGGRDASKVGCLEYAFRTKGFDFEEPALVGYPHLGAIQLLSGTHRHEAAKRAGIMLPIRMVLRSVVEAAWGTPDWARVIEDIPVKDLERATVIEGGHPPGLDERVDLSTDMS